jgi:hypothetical protein
MSDMKSKGQAFKASKENGNNVWIRSQLSSGGLALALYKYLNPYGLCHCGKSNLCFHCQLSKDLAEIEVKRPLYLPSYERSWME